MGELENYLNEKAIKPAEVHLESSSRCNAQCIMCPREGMTRYKGEMSTMVFTNAVDSLIDAPPELLHFHLNGEPLMLDIDVLVSRINYAKDRIPFSRIIFFTNASLLTEKVTHKLLDSALQEIAFSFDGGTKQDYERIRIGLNFERVIQNIAYFQNMNIRADKKIKTHAFIVPQQANKDSVTKFHLLFNAIGIDNVGGSGVQNIGGLIDSNSMKLSGQYSKGSLKAPCWRIFMDLDVMADGKLPICCQDVRGMNIIGDVLKNGLLDIWRSSTLNEIRQKHLAGKQSEVPFCDKCDFMSGFVAPEWWPRNDS